MNNEIIVDLVRLDSKYLYLMLFVERIYMYKSNDVYLSIKENNLFNICDSNTPKM